MSAVTLTDADVARIAEAVAARISKPQTPAGTIGVEELKTLLHCRSSSAVYRTLKVLGVRAYSPGKYCQADVESAIARESFKARRKAA